MLFGHPIPQNRKLTLIYFYKFFVENQILINNIIPAIIIDSFFFRPFSFGNKNMIGLAGQHVWSFRKSKKFGEIRGYGSRLYFVFIDIPDPRPWPFTHVCLPFFRRWGNRNVFFRIGAGFLGALFYQKKPGFGVGWRICNLVGLADRCQPDECFGWWTGASCESIGGLSFGLAFPDWVISALPKTHMEKIDSIEGLNSL
ncbi:MAG: hypothetical protein H6510_08435 [Acidobacteria bacterium]|nr:hypothetical protein [Acidobacteriota bacterium]MCB9397828.1 hypothetical protein [Acidobacteriota bacterium]